ncbi:MAG: NAD(P)-binding domain-containing protein [Anaerolineales bacterium]
MSNSSHPNQDTFSPHKPATPQNIPAKKPIQTIAIIGAGPSGLTAIKTMLEEGFTPIAFEQAGEIGGNWRYDETLPDGGGPAYRSLRTNSSRRMTGFSDFSFPSHLPEFLHRGDVLQYLHAYAEHFHLTPHIRLNTSVENITRHGDQWQVSVRTPSGEGETHMFDAVIVASGFYRRPFIPSFPGAETFQGQVLHSAGYKGPEGLEGKRVIVVGSGSSGVDIAAEVSEVASTVEISSRSGAWFVPYMVNGRPYDTLYNRLGKLIPPALGNPLFRKTLLGLYKKIGFTEEKLRLLNLPEFDVLRTRIVPTTVLLEKILREAVHLKPGIAQIEQAGVRYTDQTYAPADVLIYCTGYSLHFPFFPPTLVSVEGRNILRLYKRVFHQEYDNLAFLAMNFVAGATFPLAEIQARWVSQVFAGKLKLPSPAHRAQAIEQYFRHCTAAKLPPMNVQLTDYLDEIADILNIQPRIHKHLDLLQPLLLGPLVASQYRLDGPGKSAQAKAWITGK